MSSSLCCIDESRSSSSGSPQARPLGPPISKKKSWHNRSKDSRLPRSDELELNRIFVAASLPEDHPDAIKIDGRKPTVDPNIAISPGLGQRIRHRISRGSLAPSKSLHSLKQNMPTFVHRRPRITVGDLAVDDIIRDNPDSRAYDSDAISVQVASRLSSKAASVLHKPTPAGTPQLQSFEWLVPCIKDCPTEPRPTRLVSIARDGVSAPAPSIGRTSLDRSTSLPDIRDRRRHELHSSVRAPATAGRRVCSAPLRQQALTVELIASRNINASIAAARKFESREDDAPADKATGTLIQQRRVRSIALEQTPENRRKAQVIGPAMDVSMSKTGLTTATSGSKVSIHLYNMGLSKKLRSSSCFSATASERTDGRQAEWNDSGSAIAALTVPATPRTSVHLEFDAIDGSSSIYSRSIHHKSPADSRRQSPLGQPYDILHVTPNRQKAGSEVQSSSVTALLSNLTRQSAARPTLQEADRSTTPKTPSPLRASRSASDHLTADAPLLMSNSSASSLAKRSRFQEDIPSSPPANHLGRKSKRRSFFRFLGSAGIRKHYHSIPFLPPTDDQAPGIPQVDGPGEQENRLSVPTEIRSGSSPSGAGPARSRSGSTTSRSFTSDQAHSGQASPALRPTPIGDSASGRHQSLEDYERSLTAQGDSRRRISTINLDSLRNAQEEHRHDSVSPATRPLSRAKPLNKGRAMSGHNALMYKALERHQKEKAALFRKRDPAVVSDSSQPAPVFKATFGPASSPGPLPTTSDDVDPLSPLQARRTQSMYQMRHEGRLATEPTKTAKAKSSTSTFSTGSTTGTWLRRGVPPASWSRFSSHDRKGRCGSATIKDNVTPRDFAQTATVDQSEALQSEQTRSPTTGKKSLSMRRWVSESRAGATFGQVLRYYTNMFTSPIGQNRRSSIALGGKLKHPELEILPPLSAEHHHQHHHHYHHAGLFDEHARSNTRLSHFAQHVKEDAHEMQDMLTHHHHEHDLNERRSHDQGISPAELPASRSPKPEPQPTPVKQSTLQVPTELGFDGTTDDSRSTSSKTESPASRLSNMYRKTCVRLPGSLDVTREEQQQHADNSRTPSRAKSASLLSPSSARTPQSKTQTKTPAELSASPCRVTSAPTMMDTPTRSTTKEFEDSSFASSTITVRRFPSVTVIDDRKGHWRSISLVSSGLLEQWNGDREKHERFAEEY